MADPGVGAGFMEKLLDWAAAGLLALTGWIWTHTHGKIKETEIKLAALSEHINDKLVKKDDFHEYVDRADSSRKELRDSIINIYEKVDEIKTLIIKGLGNK